ncbi:hypothetical protein B9Z55_020297 [Caenorhabditis nigoni]|uniref:Uncharacterized protein n=1 Tax=Caenorhabditis nigoni TaxID=1611254 RepID=A0A2G5TM28_9PELO|nr:hypothetical protein B9Z55_020297 [Caenorhabditis nigoni]
MHYSLATGAVGVVADSDSSVVSIAFSSGTVAAPSSDLRFLVSSAGSWEAGRLVGRRTMLVMSLVSSPLNFEMFAATSSRSFLTVSLSFSVCSADARASTTKASSSGMTASSSSISA